MATTTTPEVKPAETKKAPISLTASAIAKVKETMAQQNPVPAGLRVGVVGGGCSGFSYSMQFENGAGMMDKVFDMDGLKVYVDATSVMYLNGCVVDYVETLEGAGFKFENPNVKSTCGCGSSFSVQYCLEFLKSLVAQRRGFCFCSAGILPAVARASRPRRGGETPRRDAGATKIPSGGRSGFSPPATLPFPVGDEANRGLPA